MRYIFFGSSEFAKIVLEKLLQNNLKPVLVVTQPPKPKGRKQILSPTSVQFIAEQNNIPFLTPENLNDKDFLQTIKNLQPDLILLIAYAKIIPSVLLKLPPQGFLNLHPSLLPRYRGATPIQSTILAGDKEAGVTLFLMDEQIDHGPTIANSKFPPAPRLRRAGKIRAVAKAAMARRRQNSKLSYEELMNKLAELGAELIIETVPKWLKGEINAVPQNHSLASYCHKITKEDEKINWNSKAIEIDRKVRAFNPDPGVYTQFNDLIIKILKGTNLQTNQFQDARPGEVLTLDNKIGVKCSDDIYLIEELKPAGKKMMTSEAFLRGNKEIIGAILH